MRLPRITTRRWMAAAAALAVTLGGYREAIRLERNRAEFLARAQWHIAAETYCGRLASSSEFSVIDKKRTVRTLATQESMPAALSGTVFDTTVARWSALPENPSTQAEEDGHERFREAQARAAAMAVRGRVIMDDYVKQQAALHRRLADYHAALGRKYAAAAIRPWLRVAADPPRPK